MKKILLAALLTVLLALPVNAQGVFSVDQEEITATTGDAIELNYENAVGEIEVAVCNEYNQEMWTEYFDPEENGILTITMPECNPLTTAYLHILNGDAEEVVKVTFVQPHEHQPHLVEFIRPTETEPGRMEYFYCDCGKYFEDRGCTKEITEDIDTWSYLAPVPKEEWGEGNPVPYIAKYDDKQVTDDSKPNPTWTEEEVNSYYEKEEAEIQTELEERKETSQNEESELVVEDDVIETNEVIEPVTFAVQPVEKEELTLWEQIKMFFINLFK